MNDITKKEMEDGIVKILDSEKREIILIDKVMNDMDLKRARVMDGCSFVVLTALRDIINDQSLSSKDIKYEVVDLIKFIKKQRDEVGLSNEWKRYTSTGVL